VRTRRSQGHFRAPSHATVVTGWIEITLPNGQIVKAPFGLRR
jgi:hypothetical protein